MTTLYFIPDKTGKVYLASTTSDITMMDVAVVDTAGLVAYVEDILGLHYYTEDFNSRLCRYYRLLRPWLEAHPANVLHKSFNLARLSTARQMLLWRDELKMAQWDFCFDDANSRLGALAAIEKTTAIDGLPDRLLKVAEQLENLQKKVFSNLKVVLNVNRKTIRPLISHLLDALEHAGATIGTADYARGKQDNLSKIRAMLLSEDKGDCVLDPTDTSFEVLEFETAHDEAEYIAVCQHDFNATLMVNSKAKETDNRLAALNKPTAGSKITSRSRILNLLPLALSLYDEPLNIIKLVEWFTSPIHPLPGRFRYRLAEKIASEGGYLNDKCQEVISKYLAGEYKYSDEKIPNPSEVEEAKRQQERQELVDIFVPYLKPDYSTDENAERTLRQLSAWARQRIHILPDNDDREAIATQLNALADSIDILMRLFSEINEDFNLSLAREWVRDIPSEITLPQHPARVGSVFTVSQPWDIADTASCIVWTNMEGGDVPSFECDFLLPSERNAIATQSKFWVRENEARYRYLNSILPILFAEDRVVLTYAIKQGGEEILIHPLLTRLQTQINKYNDFAKDEDITPKRTEKITAIDNSDDKAEYHFANADKISFPERMSATGLETFIIHPFDFLFDRVLGFRSAGLSNLPTLQTTRGKVAHATIARLFSPSNDTEACEAQEIRNRVNSEFNQAFQESLNECGAIFRLPENKLELNILNRGLKKCIYILLDIIEKNGLRVESCEKEHLKFIDLYGKGETTVQKEDLHGFLDMKLIDPNGRHVVFDLKWTGSRKKHKEMLEKNQAIQLAVYSELLREDSRDVQTAYFVMPWGRLVSTFQFKGRNVDVVKVEKANDDDIMHQLMESFRFRYHQLCEGILEGGDLHAIESLAYGQHTGELNLLPLPKKEKDKNKDLDQDTEYKQENKYSNYRLFKGL